MLALPAAVMAVASCTAPAGDSLGPQPTTASPSPSRSASPLASSPSPSTARDPSFQEFAVPRGSRPHDVAPAPDGRVWYTAQGSGELGVLDPSSGETRHVPLGSGSAPHGVIVGPDGAPWITDSGLNAIVRVDPGSLAVRRFPLPGSRNVNLNTAAFDGAGILWFTGQAGFCGSLDPASGAVRLFEAPRGRGPYGIATTPAGDVWLSSLAGSYIAKVAAGPVQPVDVPTRGGGARRVWSDSRGRLFVTEWFAGMLAMYEPSTGAWKQWRLPGANPQPYAVYVDERDVVWISDFGANALVAFDPSVERFRAYPIPTRGASVRQLLGRAGEVWGAESGAGKLVVLRTGAT